MSVASMLVWVLGVLAVILVLVAIRLYEGKDTDQDEAVTENPLEWLPPELHYSQIVAVERDMNCRIELAGYGRVRVNGRPDQVYRLPNGLCVPLELKNRNSPQVHKTDADQLSLQAWMLRRNGYETANFGVVVFRSWQTGKRRSLIVPLAGDLYCVSLIDRYLGLTNGAVAPVKANDRRCDSCGHAEKCGAM